LTEMLKREGRCFKCHEHGHRSQDCPNGVWDPSKTPGGGGSGGGGKPPFKKRREGGKDRRGSGQVN
jgi:hypothetical protein